MFQGGIQASQRRKARERMWKEAGSGHVHQLCKSSRLRKVQLHEPNKKCPLRKKKKKKKRLRKKKSSESVSQIFQAPSEDWKPRNFGNTTLSSCSVVETSNFLLWKVGVATVFFVCFFGQEQGHFFLWVVAAI